ncbi:MAG: OmpA family protein [Brachymonas sp.]|nr:OmpA family protein [Brachymonas sp.]
MSNEDNDRERDGMGVALPVATAVIIAIATTLFTGVGMVRKKAVVQAAPAASAPVSATAVAEQVASALASKAVPPDAAHVEVVDGVVRFYFAVGKSDVAAGAKAALAEAVAAAQAGKMLVLSGYHDSTGGAALNAELAKQRAFAVRDALLAEGVAESSITLQKPEAMPNTQGSDPNARRVDVVILQ